MTRRGDRDPFLLGSIPGWLFLSSLLIALAPCLFISSQASAQVKDSGFQLQTASGITASGPLHELGENWRVELGGPKPVRTEPDDLVELRRVGWRLPSFPDGEHLIFANGDRLPGTVLRQAGERLVFRPRWSEQGGEEKPIALPVSSLSVIWFASPDGTDRPDQLRRRLSTGKRSRDVVYLRNGDLVEGVLTDLDDKEVQIEVGKQVTAIPRDRVAIIALNTESANLLRPRGAYGRAVLANGGRLSLQRATCDRKSLAGVTLFQAPFQVPLDELVALYLYRGKAVYLSDIQPQSYAQTPYMPTALPGGFAVDACFGGGDLKVGGNTHDKGLGMHSSSRLVFDLAAGYRRFEALVGLDERSGRKGNVRVRLQLDDKIHDLGDGELVSGAPLPVRVDVGGAKRLTLIVEFGQGGGVQDDVDWLDARLIK